MGPIRISLDQFAHGLNFFSVDSSDPRCWVDMDPDIGDNNVTIQIYPEAGGDRYPVYIQFETKDKIPIEGVGFLPAGDSGKIPEYAKEGHCGGCFCLEGDIDTSSFTTPLIRNWGSDGRYTQFRFALWVGGKRIEIDPQIYNQGVGEWPVWLRWLPYRWRAWLRCWLQSR